MKNVKQNLRICMLIDAWFPLCGGGQVHTLELCKKLTDDYDVEVDLFTRELKEEDRVQGSGVREKLRITNYELRIKENEKFKVYKLGPKSFFQNFLARIFWLIYVIFFVLTKNLPRKYDLIHAHAFLAGFPAKILSKILKIPVIYTVHGTSVFLNKNGLYPLIEKILVSKIKYDCEITVARNFLEFPNVNKDIQWIPNGVEAEKFKIQNLKFKKNLKSKIKNNKNTIFKALFVGRFDAIKGVDILIKAIDILRHNEASLLNQKKFELNLVGYGFEENNLKRLVRQLHLENFIKFKGRLEGETLIKEYQEANLFVLPSLSEGNPLTLFEAWACQAPVLVTDVGDNSYYVKEGKNGFIVPSNDPLLLAKGIKKAINYKELSELGKNGYNLVKKNYTWEKMVEKTYEAYKKLKFKI